MKGCRLRGICDFHALLDPISETGKLKVSVSVRGFIAGRFSFYLHRFRRRSEQFTCDPLAVFAQTNGTVAKMFGEADIEAIGAIGELAVREFFEAVFDRLPITSRIFVVDGTRVDPGFQLFVRKKECLRGRSPLSWEF